MVGEESILGFEAPHPAPVSPSQLQVYRSIVRFGCRPSSVYHNSEGLASVDSQRAPMQSEGAILEFPAPFVEAVVVVVVVVVAAAVVEISHCTVPQWTENPGRKGRMQTCSMLCARSPSTLPKNQEVLSCHHGIKVARANSKYHRSNGKQIVSSYC